MNPAEVHGKSFALVLDLDNGESARFVGTARWGGVTLYFERPGMTRPLAIPKHRYQAILQTTDDVRDIVEADFWVRLTVSSLPDEIDVADYEKTGLRWPKE